jgi:hypothetical protein
MSDSSPYKDAAGDFGLLLRIFQYHLLARLRKDPKLSVTFGESWFFWKIFRAGSVGPDSEYRVRIYLKPQMKADFSSLFRRDASQNGQLWREVWIIVLELSKPRFRNTDNETAKHSRIGIWDRLQNVKVAVFQAFTHGFGAPTRAPAMRHLLRASTLKQQPN